MVHDELLQRLVAINSPLPQDIVSRYTSLLEGQINRINQAANEYAQHEIHIVSKSQTLDTIRANIRRTHDGSH